LLKSRQNREISFTSKNEQAAHGVLDRLWMTSPKQPKPPPEEDDNNPSPEEALRRMDQALRGSKVAGPRPLKDKPKRRDRQQR